MEYWREWGKFHLIVDIIVSQRIGSKVTKSSVDSSSDDIKSSNVKEPVRLPTNLVFGYLNLFSDGVVSYIVIFVK